MEDKAYTYNHPLNTNNDGNLDPPLIVISDPDTDVEDSHCRANLLNFGQELVQKGQELKCFKCAATTPSWRNYEEDVEKKAKNFENLYKGMPTPLPNSFHVEGKSNKPIPEVGWDEYKSLLLRLWEEKSLDDLFAKKGSSSMTSPGLNACGEIPYIIDLLTNEFEFQPPHNEPEKEDASAFSAISATLSGNKTSRKQQQQQQQEPINSRLIPPAVEKTPQSLPLLNIAKETSKAQGEANGRPTLFLRSNASLQPQEEGGGEESPSRRPNPLSKMPFDFFTNREHDRTRRSTVQNENHNHLVRNSGETGETLVVQPSPPQPFQNSEPPRSYLGRLNKRATNCSTSEVCVHDGEIQNLKLELEKAQSRIANLSFKMNDQNSHLEGLIKERNVLQEKFNEFLRSNPHHLIPRMSYPLFTQQGYKTPHPAMYPPGIEAYTCGPHQALGRRASWQYPYEIPRGRMTNSFKGRPEELMSHLTGSDPRALEDLRDRIVALQMQNIELNLFLKKEEVRRKEAEQAVKKEKEYVRKLQESIQDISTSTLIIDPLTYKQVADNYIASQKKPVRRTHTCNPYIGSSDLVCDSSRLKVVQNKNQSTSCPSSPLGSAYERKSSNLNSRVLPSTPTETGTPLSGSPSSDCIIFSLDKASPSEVQDTDLNWNIDGEGSSPLNSHQYQELLTNLDNLQVSSSPS